MLTKAQQKIYRFIEQFFRKNNYSPTISEIAHGIDIKSRGVVHRYLKSLVDANKIELSSNKHRGIKLLHDFSNKLLLSGKISCGQPIEHILIDSKDCIDLTSKLVAENNIALQVKDDSMIEEGIFANDLLICHKSTHAKDDDTVIVLIDNHCAFLRRIKYNDDNTVTLKPINSRLLPQVFEKDRINIIGNFIGAIRLI